MTKLSNTQKNRIRDGLYEKNELLQELINNVIFSNRHADTGKKSIENKVHRIFELDDKEIKIPSNVIIEKTYEEEILLLIEEQEILLNRLAQQKAKRNKKRSKKRKNTDTSKN